MNTLIFECINNWRCLENEKHRLIYIFSSIAFSLGALDFPYMSFSAESVLCSDYSAMRSYLELYDVPNASNLAAEICEVLNELHVSSQELIDAVTLRSIPDVSRIKDLNGDNELSINDCSYLLHFLTGENNYQHSYTDMDATNDYIIDQLDAYAYLDYFVYNMTMNNLPIPYFPHDSGSAPSVANESRDYVKHSFADGVSPCANDVTYNPDVTTTITGAVFNPTTFTTCADEDNKSSVIDRSFSTVYDPRVVNCSGASGAFISENVILTAAHVMYDRSQHTYNTNGVFKIYLKNSSGTIQPHTLSINSVHIPKEYIMSSSYSYKTDYALLVINPDSSLPSDNYFTALGVPLDSATTNGVSNSIEGFPDGLSKKEVHLSSGILEPPSSQSISKGGTPDIYIKTTASASTGSSGGPMYVCNTYSNRSLDPIIGEVIGSNGGAVRSVFPLLKFCFNNSFLI